MWKVMHGRHVAFLYDGPTSGRNGVFPQAKHVIYPTSGQRGVVDDLMRCDGCQLQLVMPQALTWTEEDTESER